MEVCFHELKDKVEIFIIFGFKDAVKFDDVGVVEFVEDGDFPVGSLGVDFVVEGIEYFFECVLVFVKFVEDFPDVAVGAAAEEFLDVVEFEDVGFDFLTHGFL